MCHIQLEPAAAEGFYFGVIPGGSNGVARGGHDGMACPESLGGNLKAKS